jgi:hypothetical protein
MNKLERIVQLLELKEDDEVWHTESDMWLVVKSVGTCLTPGAGEVCQQDCTKLRLTAKNALYGCEIYLDLEKTK